MGGRRIYHARGKVLGGSSSVNGMIFQRGNPMDYERWATVPGMETWDYAHCLPYFKRMETCLAAAPTTRGAGTPARSCWSAGRRRARSSARSSRPCSRPGCPLTDDVNGYRQEGFAAFDRNIHKGKRLSAARAYLHPVMSRDNLEVETLAHATQDPVRRHPRHGRRVRARAAAAATCERGEVDPLRRRDQLAAAAAALRRRQRRRARARSGSRGRRPPRRRREPAGPPRGLHPVRLQAAGLDGAALRDEEPPAGRPGVAAAQARPGRDEPLRGGRLHALQRRGGRGRT